MIRPRFLLLHPWIADVSAYNFWVRPLGLYALAEWLWERGGEPVLLDCLSSAPAPGKFPRVPVGQPAALRGFRRRYARYGISLEEARARAAAARPFEAVLVTSTISYWYPGVRWAIDEVRRTAGSAPVALGGAYPTLWPEHARENSGADRVFSGALEDCGAELAAFLGLPLTPVAAHRPWHELGLHDGARFSALRTARGCPFRCSYCASRQLAPEFAPRDPEGLRRELVALAGLGVEEVAFYDDALLVGFRERVLPALEESRRRGCTFALHTPNGLHARLVTGEVAGALARSGFRTVRLALESADPGRQESSGAKVRSEELAAAVRFLLAAGFARADIGVYLLLGLPGQSLEEVREGVRFVRSLGVRPHLAEFSPVPGTREWSVLEAQGAVSAGMDPLLTNNTVFYRMHSGYAEEEVEALRRECRNPLGG